MTTDGSNTSTSLQLSREVLPGDLAACHAMIQQQLCEVELLHTERLQFTEQLREVELLRTQHQQVLEQLTEAKRQMERLEYKFQQLLRRFTGRSSEKLDANRLALFEKLLEQLAPTMTPAAPATPTTESALSSSAQGAPHGRRKIPADLPCERVIHDLPEEQKLCPCCGKMRCVIGKEIHKKLDWVPAKIKVIEHVWLTYACRTCQEAAAETGDVAQIVTADVPSSPIEKGLAEPGLLTRQCLSMHIPTKAQMKKHVNAWVQRRNRAKVRIDWRFTTADARIKLRKLYPSLQE